MARPAERLVVQRVQLLRDVVAHDQRKDLGDVAVLREKQIEFLPPPRHVAAGVVGTQGHLRRKETLNREMRLKGRKLVFQLRS